MDAMPVEKRSNATVFRARLKVRQQRYDGPNRSTEQEAADDLRKLEAARSESADVLLAVVKDLHTRSTADTKYSIEWRQDLSCSIEKRWSDIHGSSTTVGS